MAITLVVILVLLLIIGMLWMPVECYINTGTKQYFLQARGLARAEIEEDTEEILKIRLITLLGHFSIYPLRSIGNLKKTDKSNRKRTQRKGKMISLRRLLAVLRSFSVEEFKLDMDTGDCILNAKLIPAFALFNNCQGNYHINFQGRNQLILKIKNRPILMLKSFINP